MVAESHNLEPIDADRTKDDRIAAAAAAAAAAADTARGFQTKGRKVVEMWD